MEESGAVDHDQFGTLLEELILSIPDSSNRLFVEHDW